MATKAAKAPPEHKTIADAIAAAQANMSNATKDSKNPHFRTSYASLAAVRDVVIPAFSAQGVAVLQFIEGGPGVCRIRTVLYWREQEIEVGNAEISTGNGRNAAQEIGSIATYLRRYQLAAVGGIAQEDDDAQSLKPQPQRKPEPQRRPEPPKRRAPPNTRSPEAVDWKTRGDLRCPKCAGDLRDNIRQRARAENERPAISCGNQKCGFTEWSITNAIKLVEGMNKAPAANGAKGGKYDQSDFVRF